MYLYSCNPIDWFDGCLSLDRAYGEIEDFSLPRLLKCLIWMFVHKQWEGDLSQEPFVFFIPAPQKCSPCYGYVWKQNNNGQTFIASPIRLPWLESDLVGVME